MAMLSDRTHAEFSFEFQIECLLVENLTNVHVPNQRDLADRIFGNTGASHSARYLLVCFRNIRRGFRT